MSANVEDFDDLGNPIVFSFGGNTFEIPPIVPRKSKLLMKMGRDIQRKAKENEKLVKQYEESGEEMPDEIQDKVDEIFDFQMDFIIAAGIKQKTDSGYQAVEKSFMDENWPNKLIQRVFRRINENFVESEQEKKF